MKLISYFCFQFSALESRLVSRIVEGWQDEFGFHFGRQPRHGQGRCR